MIRGNMQKMIVIKDTGSRYFDRAYFVLRSDIEEDGTIGKSEMVKEAVRIVDEGLPPFGGKRTGKVGRGAVLAFLLGALSCGAAVAAATLLFGLF